MTFACSRGNGRALPYLTHRIPGGTITVVVGIGERGEDVVLATSYLGIGDIRDRLAPGEIFRKATLEPMASVLTRYCDGSGTEELSHFPDCTRRSLSATE